MGVRAVSGRIRLMSRIQAVRLSAQFVNRVRFRHDPIVNDGTLKLWMGESPGTMDTDAESDPGGPGCPAGGTVRKRAGHVAYFSNLARCVQTGENTLSHLPPRNRR